MAEIKIDAVVLSASASFSGNIKRIIKSSSSLNGQASVSSRVIRITKDKTALNGHVSVSSSAIKITKDKATISGAATLSNVNSRLIKYGKTAIRNASSVNSKSHKYKTVQATINVESTLEAFTYDRDIHSDMHTYLPPTYSDLEDVQIMLDAEASEVIRMQAKLSEMLDQFYVNSATYGLERWETETSIESIPQRSLDSRRHFIIAKLRGFGTATKPAIKEVVDAIYTSDIVEDNPNYTIEITILGKRGVPKNLEDIEVAVNDVIPAHLQTQYNFTYLPWSEVTDAELTWEQADEFTMKGLEETFLIDPGYSHKN